MKLCENLRRGIAVLLAGTMILSLDACSLFGKDDDEKRTEGVSKTAVFDFSEDATVIDIDGSNSEFHFLTLKNSKDKNSYRFDCEGCRLEDDKLVIEEGGHFNLLTELGRIGTITLDLADIGTNYDINIEPGYSGDKQSEVSSKEELIWGDAMWFSYASDEPVTQEFDGLPNFFGIYSDSGEIIIKSITLTYDGVTTELVRAELNADFYGYLLEGEYYDSSKEIFSREDGKYTFYLNVYPDSPYINTEAEQPYGVLRGIPDTMFTTGKLITKDGVKKAKTEPLEIGDSLEVNIGAYTFEVPLPVSTLFEASILDDLMPYSTTSSSGTLNAVVVPLYFSDQSEYATDEYRKTLYSYLGRVLEEDGSVTDYSSSDVDNSFTDYFDQASYGKLSINCFVTDFYEIDGSYEEDSERALEDDEETFDAIQNWINENYSKMNSKLDQDNDKAYDAVIFLGAPTADFDGFDYYTLSYQGAYNHILDYGPDRIEASKDELTINYFSYANCNFFKNVDRDGYTTGALCHEFSHQLGLIDYYDVTYSGINAVGTYDMQSSNEGDWNAFSKFCAGWIRPTVVTPEEIDAGVEITINAFEKDGSAIVIPTEKTKINSDGSISPFSEYMIVDLYTPEGLYADTYEYYSLYESGVRIYHADGRMITIDLMTKAGAPYKIGTNLYSSVYTSSGCYQLELIQKSGINTFTDLTNSDLYPVVGPEDLFYAGDSFSMDTHKSFYMNGRMNDGSELTYTINVISIENGMATIRISR